MPSLINNMRVKTAYMGLLLAFALILSYIETLIPFQFGIPGVKLGLGNLAVLICLYTLGYREAFLITVLKAITSGFLLGSLFMIIYSMAGAVFSFAVMALMVKVNRFHVPVVSAAGGVMHNAGQLIVAYFVLDSYYIAYYVPVLIIAGLLTGILLGMIISLILPYIRKVIKNGGDL